MLSVEPIPVTQWFIGLRGDRSVARARSEGVGVPHPRLQLILRHPTRPDEISDRVVTKRITTGEASP